MNKRFRKGLLVESFQTIGCETRRTRRQRRLPGRDGLHVIELFFKGSIVLLIISGINEPYMLSFGFY